jgi:hypothetical protein
LLSLRQCYGADQRWREQLFLIYPNAIKPIKMIIRSILKDERINAYNALAEISVGEYLGFAKSIIDANEFQRKRVIKSKIKDILREDLLLNCLIPSIVLAVTAKDVLNIKNVDDFATSTAIIDEAIAQKDILIIDGLQRTYVMLGLEEDLKKQSKDEELSKFYNHKIRAEIYLGLEREGLLYRMITLNTGQTTMSIRHLMEILYLDYSRVGIDGIRLISDKEDDKIPPTTTDFSFKTILDGFNSFIEKDEALIDRTEVLDNIRALDTLKKTENKKNIFVDFLLTYKYFLDKIVEISNDWHYNKENLDDSLSLSSNPFGKSALDILKKSQVLTGLGATLGFLGEKFDIGFDSARQSIDGIYCDDDDWNSAFALLLKRLDIIKDKSKKIGNDQRYFFKVFFRNLLSERRDSYLNFNSAVEEAYKETTVEKSFK